MLRAGRQVVAASCFCLVKWLVLDGLVLKRSLSTINSPSEVYISVCRTYQIFHHASSVVTFSSSQRVKIALAAVVATTVELVLIQRDEVRGYCRPGLTSDSGSVYSLYAIIAGLDRVTVANMEVIERSPD